MRTHAGQGSVSRSATDDEIAVEVLARLLGVTVEEARRISEEERNVPIGELKVGAQGGEVSLGTYPRRS